MPRLPIGEKAMTPAERQKRHRDIVTAKPMTKSEREDLAKLIRNREKVMKAAAGQRSAELLAEFEQQMASEYSYDQDKIWKAAAKTAATAVEVAKAEIADRCAELGIPARFAPSVHFGWSGRGENAVKERRAELRNVAKTRIAAIEKAACTKIEMACLEAQTQVIAHGLTSASAIDFFDALPKVEVLMPPLEMASIEQILQTRKAGERLPYTAALEYRRAYNDDKFFLI
jgi:hypothetical protein